MSGRNPYYMTIANEYLKVTKKITGATKQEVQEKAAYQIARWKEQEARARQRAKREQGQQEAARRTATVQAQIDSYKAVLESSIKVDHRVRWESMKNRDQYNVPQLSLAAIYEEIGVPRENKAMEFLFPANKQKRLEGEAKARQIQLQRLELQEAERANFLQQQKAQNDSIDAFRNDWESAKIGAIEKYFRVVFEGSTYPQDYQKEFDCQYDVASKTLVVSVELPPKSAVPHTLEHKYVASQDQIIPVDMKPKEFDAFYEDCLYRICLRTVHEVFQSDDRAYIQSVVFNGWVRGVDPKTGQGFHSCIISCQVSRQEFEGIDLRFVSLKECFRNLKGLAAGPLSELAPVRPIMNISREDPRFVASREVIEHLDSSTNLAAMDWEEFEHLVRQLFEKVFAKYGGEVKVTRASRDGGVDAVAFDPEPIRGGKYVIQAKRYNNVVPVSAVRDLYGTMINEGAAKGILVTTSYYGNDSREFVKDKPITLIDGSNLVYMFQEYGYQVTIRLQQ